jgi:TolB-like protein/cytochrome c-type biogenesis protein CcmH/NrfG
MAGRQRTLNRDMSSFFAELKRRNVIRIALFYGAGAWVVLQVADVLLGIVEAPEGSLRLLAIVLALGFPFALVLSWAFEITPEGIRRDRDLPADGRASAEAARKLNIATIVLLLLAIALLSWNMFGNRAALPPPDRAAPPAVSPPPPPAGTQDLSIAVLPFVNMSQDPANEYFSEGLSEEVLNVLARIDNFRVAGRTSSFAFKGQNQDLRAIGERLGVANILEGSVRRQGDRVRVTAQLIDSRTGYHLWSDTYDRQLDDIFAIQDDIATEVVRALRRTLLPGDAQVISQSAKGDVEAYNLFLRGQFHARLRTPEGLRRALEEFQQAVLIDPDYAPPYAGIAMVYALLDNYNYRSLEATGPLANRALERALEIDPNSDEAWAVKGLLLSQGPDAKERNGEARAALERAVEINPNNAFAHLWLSGTLLPDLVAARSALQRAYAVDPLSPVIVYRQVMWSLQGGEQADIERYLGELREVAPEWFMTWFAIGTVAMQEGRVADGAVAFARVRRLNPEYLGAVSQEAFALEMLGRADAAGRLLADALERRGGEELGIALAGHRARRAIAEQGLAAGLAVYRQEIERLQTSNIEALGDLALFEISAGEPAAAERRVRSLLGIGPEEVPDCNFSQMTPCIALVMALNGQGRRDEAAVTGARLRTMIETVRGQGFQNPVMLLIESYLGHVTGEGGSLETAMPIAIERGWRVPLPVIRWLFAGHVDAAQLERLTEMMEAELAQERARYEALQAAPGAGTARLSPFSFGSAVPA